MGLGYKGPTYHVLRTNLLEESKKELQLLVDTYRSSWEDCGCTIMADGWKDIRQRSLINFLVYSPKGTSFIKSVDASDMISDASTLCNLFTEIVEIVGWKNVVHVVTDNAANYKAAGRLLNDKYPSILWTPCVAHCLNLMLKDIAKIPHIETLAHRASLITVFVYNHKWTLSWLRNIKGWTEILLPGDTRFATTFIALKSLYDHKSDLQAMITSGDFLGWNGSKTKKAKDVCNIVLDNQFWNDCLVVVKIASPLVRLLRIVDSDERPSLGYIYEGMIRANKTIKETFKYVRRLYQPYISILEERWERQMHQDIHAAAFWLNPTFQYDKDTVQVCHSPDVMDGFITIISNPNIAPNHNKMIVESSTFRERLGSFGNTLTQSSSKNTRPDEWWRFFGHSAPNIQKLALRILSQTSSSSGCERNWSAFERIHTKRRNRLEHQRLNDLVYIHYNLCLKNRNFNKSNNLDPIDYECIDKIDTWVVENEPPREPELNLEDLENIIAQVEGEGQEQREGGQTEFVHNIHDSTNYDDDDDVVAVQEEDVLIAQDGINFSSFDVNQGNEEDGIHGNDDN
ncbi:uncharacterized protein LOC120258657 [Dioscorea cayenensis subsp. rotundata]|uniref:Uncharacterized protein LOC120258657 n=1 Tax=Dioscorea cayennensis subsp. rotundata TaxID=55577 RepID=A0AB40B5W8_DIOCR|nr:uncharacterized protein LOC120258657 [Dioscorea cayenensis subsp. rotundata]